MARRTIGQVFREARDRKGLSQRAVAAVAGVSQTAARNMEADTAGAIELRVAHRLLAAVGLTLADISPLMPPVRLKPAPAKPGRPRNPENNPGKS